MRSREKEDSNNEDKHKANDNRQRSWGNHDRNQGTNDIKHSKSCTHTCEPYS